MATTMTMRTMSMNTITNFPLRFNEPLSAQLITHLFMIEIKLLWGDVITNKKLIFLLLLLPSHTHSSLFISASCRFQLTHPIQRIGIESTHGAFCSAYFAPASRGAFLRNVKRVWANRAEKSVRDSLSDWAWRHKGNDEALLTEINQIWRCDVGG